MNIQLHKLSLQFMMKFIVDDQQKCKQEDLLFKYSSY